MPISKPRKTTTAGRTRPKTVRYSLPSWAVAAQAMGSASQTPGQPVPPWEWTGIENCRYHQVGMEVEFRQPAQCKIYPLGSDGRSEMQTLGLPRAAPVEFPDGCVAVVDDLPLSMQTGNARIVASPRS